MKTLLTLFAGILTTCCIAQPEPKKWGTLTVNGQVKMIREYISISEDKAKLYAGPYDTRIYSVDSFSTSGYYMLTYRVRYGDTLDYTRYLYEFDSTGNIIEGNELDSEEGITYTTTFMYDNNGNIIEQINQPHSNGYNYMRTGTKFTYHRGRITCKEYIVSKTCYYFYPDGRLAKEERCYPKDPGMGCTIKKYRYDGNSRKIVTKTNHWGELEYIRFDRYGNIIENDGLSTDYVYDKHGNWIRQIEELPLEESPFSPELASQRFYRLTVRDIEYY